MAGLEISNLSGKWTRINKDQRMTGNHLPLKTSVSMPVYPWFLFMMAAISKTPSS